MTSAPPELEAPASSAAAAVPSPRITVVPLTLPERPPEITIAAAITPEQKIATASSPSLAHAAGSELDR